MLYDVCFNVLCLINKNYFFEHKRLDFLARMSIRSSPLSMWTGRWGPRAGASRSPRPPHSWESPSFPRYSWPWRGVGRPPQEPRQRCICNYLMWKQHFVLETSHLENLINFDTLDCMVATEPVRVWNLDVDLQDIMCEKYEWMPECLRQTLDLPWLQ